MLGGLTDQNQARISGFPLGPSWNAAMINNQDPAEGSRKVIEGELQKQEQERSYQRQPAPGQAIDPKNPPSAERYRNSK